MAEMDQNIKKEKKKKENLPQSTAVGRRKTSTARVRLVPGSGRVVVNRRPLETYFPREVHRIVLKQPLKTIKAAEKFDIFANVSGGGLSGQAEAIRHGIARALIVSDDLLRTTLKKAGFLTRDSRIKERKKYGRKRARKRFQFSKR